MRWTLAAMAFAPVAFAQPSVPFAVESSPRREDLSFFTFGTAVTATGDGYALTWQDRRSGFDEIWGALLDLDGGVRLPGVRRLVSHEAIPIPDTTRGCLRGGELLFLATSGARTLHTLVTDLQLTPTRLAQVPGTFDGRPELGCELPTAYLATLRFVYVGAVPTLNVLVMAIDPGGQVVTVPGGDVANDLGLTPLESGPSIAFNGSHHLVVWAQSRGGGTVIRGTRIVGGAVGTPFDISTEFARATAPSVAWNTFMNLFEVVFATGSEPDRNVALKWVDAVGVVGAPVSIANDPGADEFSPAICSTTGQQHFIGSLLIPNGAATPQVRLTELLAGSPVAQRAPRPGYVDEVQLACERATNTTFLKLRDFSRNIRTVGQLIRVPYTAGSVIDPSPTTAAQTLPRLLATRIEPTLSWMEAGAVRVKKLSPGAVASTVIPNADPFAIVGAGAGRLITLDWEFPTAMGTVRLFDDATLAPLAEGAFPAGPVVMTSAPVWTGNGFTTSVLSEPPGAGRRLDVITVGLDASVVDRRSLPVAARYELASAWAADSGIWGIGMAANDHAYAVCLRDAGFTPLVDFDAGTYVPRIQIASDGKGFLAVWNEGPLDSARMAAQRLDESCQQLGPRVDLGPSVTPWISYPAVVFDGRQYVVVYAGGPLPRGDLILATLNQGGVTRLGRTIVAHPAGETQPTLMATAPGQWTVAWSEFDSQESVSARRVWAVRVSDDGPGATCATDAQCFNGVCSGGFCCNRSCNGGCESCASGSCQLLNTNAVCRPVAHSCDIDERCDGITNACPQDTVISMCVPDGGVPSDGGSLSDGGSADAGEPDGGAPGDGGALPDGKAYPIGCACQAVPSAWVLLALWPLRSGRRSPRARGRGDASAGST